ncbi:MAG: hypothetical protein ACHQ5A_05855, partial [Opitutales bacterium]
VQENLLAAQVAGAPELDRLIAQYYDVRAGLGFNKTPAAYGANPTDPYSHTPGHSGAQQPGMTGQVKEEILTRFGELGVVVGGGRLSFRPALLRAGEFTSAPGVFRTLAGGTEATHALPAGALAFTFCGVPVVYRLSSGPAGMRLHGTDGPVRVITGTTLDATASAEVFSRAGRITLLEVSLGEAYRPL